MRLILRTFGCAVLGSFAIRACSGESPGRVSADRFDGMFPVPTFDAGDSAVDAGMRQRLATLLTVMQEPGLAERLRSADIAYRLISLGKSMETEKLAWNIVRVEHNGNNWQLYAGQMELPADTSVEHAVKRTTRTLSFGESTRLEASAKASHFWDQPWPELVTVPDSALYCTHCVSEHCILERISKRRYRAYWKGWYRLEIGTSTVDAAHRNLCLLLADLASSDTLSIAI